MKASNGNSICIFSSRPARGSFPISKGREATSPRAKEKFRSGLGKRMRSRNNEGNHGSYSHSNELRASRSAATEWKTSAELSQFFH